jgi:hypothetical protein
VSMAVQNDATGRVFGQLSSRLRRPLNGVDRFLLAVDRTIRLLGGPGFETQTFVWLNGQIDTARLSHNLQRLNHCFPVLTARLVERDGPYWRLRAQATPLLREAHLPTANRQAVLDHAALLLSGPTDPADVDPVRFQLLHRPNGHDVLVIQYNHVLIDHNDAILLLRELDQPQASTSARITPSQSPWRDLIWKYLRRFPRGRRHAAAAAAEDWRRSLRGGAVQLSQQHPNTGHFSFGLATRRLDREATAALRAQTVRICGMPSVSMGVLGSAFRAVAQLAGFASGHYLNAGIGVDLGLNRGGTPALQNLTTLLPLQVARRDLGDRDALIRTLSQKLREELSHDMDLGVLELAAVYGRQQHRARWAIELLLRYCVSLWYGSFGTLRDLGPQFCGTPVEEVFSAGPTWSPVGLTLLVNEFAGRLHLQATFIPEYVSASKVNDFLDAVLTDLPRG